MKLYITGWEQEFYLSTLKIRQSIKREGQKMFNAVMLAITFALSFALMFLGVIVLIHFQTWIGGLMILVGGLRFFRDLQYT